MTEDDIRKNSTPQSFSRGKSYYQNGAVSDTIRRGNDLEGQVQGSAYAPYRIHIVLSTASNVIAATCTCPYDWGGYCKHIVAVLLAYLYEPQQFVERPPVQDALMERTKEQLVDLVRQMVLRYPDLQTLIDRPIPGAGGSGGVPVDTAMFRRELRQAVNSYYSDDDWGDSSVDSTIYSVANAAERFASAGDWRGASAIYCAIIDECLDENTSLVDDEGEFITAIESVLQGMVRCLERPEITGDDTERRAIINHLIDAYIWDVNMGGIGLSDRVMPDALLTHVKQSDIRPIRERIQEAQRHKAKTAYGQWGVETYEDLLMDLDLLDHTDPEETLRRLRDQGMYHLLFRKLVELKRVDEAISLVEEHLTTPYERLRALPVLTAAGQDDAAVRLGQEALQAAFDYQLAYWLVDRYTARHDSNKLFDLRLKLMEQSPSEASYTDLKETAAALGNWETVQPAVIRQLEQAGQFEVLTRIYLVEQEWDAAWRTLDKVNRKSILWGVPSLDLEVASRSREARPEKAIPVYIRYARRAIDNRHRSSYAQAAEYLSIVRDLYLETDGEEEWLDLINRIREEFPRLRALHDELKKAGL